MRPIHAIRTLLLASLVSIVPASAFAGVFLSITIAPPILPVYAQPICPGDGYLWTPGYWAYGEAGYYWVPGTWVLAPRPGFLWTPGYWGWGGGFYAWHAGYWGPHVGFYGGVNYGYGYGGNGFYGGRWEGGHFFYNAAVLHVNNTVVRNTYIDRTVIHTTVVNRTSFNGPGGLQARPGPQEQAAMREQHVQPTSEQMSHEHFASTNRANFASVNGGRPANPAVARPMTSPSMVNHAAFNNQNNRPAYNVGQANNGYHPQANNGYHAPANNAYHPQAENAYHPQPQNAYHAPANNEVHAAPAPHYTEPARQGGGGQPHNEPHQGGGGGEHEHR